MSVVAVFKDCLKFSICIAKYVVCKRETKISDCKRKYIEIQIHKTIQLSFTCDKSNIQAIHAGQAFISQQFRLNGTNNSSLLICMQ